MTNRTPRRSIGILGILIRARQLPQPGFAPLDPEFIIRFKVGRGTVEGTEPDFHRLLLQAEEPTAAGGAETTAGESGDLTGVGKGRARPDGKEDEGGTARFAAIGAMAETDAEGLTLDAIDNRPAEAASSSPPHHGRQESRLVGSPGGRRFAAISRSSSVAEGPNFS